MLTNKVDDDRSGQDGAEVAETSENEQIDQEERQMIV